MSIMDELKKLTRPYDDDGTLIDDDDLDMDVGASEPVYTRPVATQAAPQAAPVEPAQPVNTMGGMGNMGGMNDAVRNAAPISMGLGGSENIRFRVVMSQPKTFFEVKEIANNICQGNAVIVNCEETDEKVARRVVDFLSGCAFALNGSIKPAAAKVYIIAPKDVGVDEPKAAESES